MNGNGIINTYNPPFANLNSAHRRLRAVVIDIPLETQLFTEGRVVALRCIEGLPEGAKYIGAVTDMLALSVFCIFEHESFAPVASGNYIPVQSVRYEKVVTE